jgi:curli production assembly/transport component CsgG
MKKLLMIMLATTLTGCASLTMEALREEPVAVTAKQDLIAKLPDLDGPPMTIAVYGFRDLTGQNKSNDKLALFSKAVTQGAESFLIKSLQDSKSWFRVVERVGLDNLIKERQLIRNQREVYEGKDARPLKPLTVAGIMIEGGIIGYDSNIRSGGNGARWLGIGASQQYRVDEVIISLRLVSINSGEVLLTTAVSKTIYSTAHNVGVFKFFDQGTRSLELENGAALNEPTTYAVRVAIEQGVYEMIMAGEKKGLWRFRAHKPEISMAPPAVKEERKNELVQENTTKTTSAPEASPAVAPADVPVSKTQTRRATVVEWSNVRVSREHQSEKIANLRPGATVEILAEDKDFYNIRVDGKEGWVAKRFMKVHQ